MATFPSSSPISSPSDLTCRQIVGGRHPGARTPPTASATGVMAWVRHPQEVPPMMDTPELRPMGKGEASPHLIDDVMPNRHASRVEMVVVEADPGPTYAALRDLDLMSVHSPLVEA